MTKREDFWAWVSRGALGVIGFLAITQFNGLKQAVDKNTEIIQNHVVSQAVQDERIKTNTNVIVEIKDVQIQMNKQIADLIAKRDDTYIKQKIQ